MAESSPLDGLRRLPKEVGSAAAWSAAQPRRATALALVLVLLAGAGLPGLDRSPDPASAVPRDTGTAEASDAVTDRFKSTVLQKATIQFRVNPDACRSDSARNLPARHGPGGAPGPSVDCDNVTDETYLRAMEEFYRFLRDQRTATGGQGGVVTYMMGPSTFYKLANWTVAGGADDAPDGAFHLPPADDRARWRAVEEVTRESLWDALSPTVNPEHTVASATFVVEAGDPRSVPAIGRDVLDARDAYVRWVEEGEGNYTVFGPGNPPLVGADPPAESARTAAVLEDGLAAAVPLAAAAAAALLLVATRRLGPTGAGLAATAGTTVGAAGVAGWAGVGVSPYLLGVLPVAAGLGLDASLRLLRPGGADWDEAASAAGPGLVVTGLAAGAGAAVWAASPAPLVAGGGIAVLAAALLAPVLAALLVPAWTAVPDPASDRLGFSFEPLDLSSGTRRAAATAGLVALVVVATPGLLAVQTAPPDPAVRNLPEDDPFRREHERSQALFFPGEGDETRFRSHIVVVRGDIMDPEAHRYLDRVWEELRDEAHARPALDASTSRHLPFLVRKWQEVGNGTESVARSRLAGQLAGTQGSDSYPSSRSEVEATVDAIFDSPMATFGSLLVDHPRNNITVVPVLARTGSLEDVRSAQAGMDAAVARAADDRPDDVEVDVVGPGTTMLLLDEAQTPWLAALSAAGLVAAGGAAALLSGRRDGLRALLAAAGAGLVALAVSGMTGIPVRPAFAAPLLVAAAAGGWVLGRDRAREALLLGLAYAAVAAPFVAVPYQALAQASLAIVVAGLAGGGVAAALRARQDPANASQG